MQFVTSDKYAICNALDGSLRRKKVAKRWEEGAVSVNFAEIPDTAVTDRRGRVG